MAKNLKFTTILTALTAILILALSVIYFSPVSVQAEKGESSVILDDNSLFDLYSENLFYTRGNSLYLLTSQSSYCYENAFDLPLLSFAVTGTNIYAVCGTNEGNNSVFVFDYNSNGITNKQKLVLTGINEELQGTIFMVNRSGDTIYFLRSGSVYELTQNSQARLAFTVTNSILESTNNFCVQNNVLYILKNENVYKINNLEGTSELGAPILEKVNSLTYYDNTIAVVKDSQILYKNSETQWTAMTSATPMDFKQLKIFGNTLYGMSDTAIKKYIIRADYSLEFNRIYDNEIYENPTEYTIIKFAYANECRLFVSPKNLEVKATIAKNSKVLVLSETDDYYYVIYNNIYGFIDKDSLTLMDGNTTTALGEHAQPLHDKTVIYQYPYSTSTKLMTIDVTDIVTIRSNVAEKNGVMESDYYYVSFTTSSGELVNGYVLASYLASYTDYKAPTARKTARIQVDTVGTTAKAYILPDDTSSLLYYLNDGDEVGLLEDFNKDSEWTKILVNNQTCYIKTANLVYKSLTKMQITLIIICSLLVVSTVITVCVLHARKTMLKKQSFN